MVSLYGGLQLLERRLMGGQKVKQFQVLLMDGGLEIMELSPAGGQDVRDVLRESVYKLPVELQLNYTHTHTHS